MENPEHIPHFPETEAEKIFQGVLFVPVYNKWKKLMGYKSTDPNRKVIELPANAVFEVAEPQDVKIITDSDPSDPQKGKYLGELVIKENDGVSKLNLDEWEAVEKKVNLAEVAERGGQKAKVILHRETGLAEEARTKLDREDMIKQAKRPRIAAIAAQLDQTQSQVVDDLLGQENSPERALVSLRWQNLIKALRQAADVEKKLDTLHGEEAEVLHSLGVNPTGAELEALREIRGEVEKWEEAEEALLGSSPEAFYGLHLQELKKYKADLENGKIVETPYVTEQVVDVVTHLRAGIPVLVYGHLGSGKTEFAMHVAKNYILKDRADLAPTERTALVISGSKKMSAAEFYGHQILDITKIEMAELDRFVGEVEEKYNTWVTQNPNLSEGDKNRAHDRLLQTYLTQFKTGTISRYFLGPIYRAMEQGRPVIVDEVNAIPHELLISLNHILTRSVGEVVNVQQDSGKTVTIKDGYGVIMTGNLNQGQERYVDRQDMDAAFLSRLYKKEYDYLPQTTEGGSLAEAGGKGKNELFLLLLSRLMDEHGNLDLPLGSMTKLWSLAKAARLTQNVFAGKEIDKAYYYKEAAARGVPYLLKETVLSLRNLDKIITSWQRDGYKYELNYYIYNEFIGPSTSPSDRAYLYQVFKDQFGFFESDGWDKTPKYGQAGVVNAFDLNSPKNKANELRFAGPRTTVEYAYGEPPTRAKWPGSVKEKVVKTETKTENPPEQKPERRIENETAPEQAQEIMGEQFFGPEAVEKVFDLIIPVAEVPPVPFSPDQLELAKQKGLDLVLYATEWPNMNDITGQSIAERCKNKKKDGTPLLASIDWYKTEDFFINEKPRGGWRLVSRETIPNSADKNYLEQTERLKTYLEEFTELGDTLGEEVVEALVEFAEVKKQYPELAAWVKSSVDTEWQQASAILAGLKLNKEFRESFVDWLYRTVLAERAKDLTILPSAYSWTNSRGSSGRLVLAGSSVAYGAGVLRWRPRYSTSGLGAVFSAEKL